MMGKTHLAISVLILYVLSEFTSLLQPKVLAAVLLFVGTLMPDIDDSKSTLGRKFKPIGWIFKHRGFFHSIFAMVFFTILVHVALDNTNLSLVFMIGYASHLLGDGMTKAGVPLFFPKKNKISGPFVVGGVFEALIYWCLILLAIYLIL